MLQIWCSGVWAGEPNGVCIPVALPCQLCGPLSLALPKHLDLTALEFRKRRNCGSTGQEQSRPVAAVTAWLAMSPHCLDTGRPALFPGLGTLTLSFLFSFKM